MSFFFFFKQKTAYEMRISDWSSDVCSSDLLPAADFHALMARSPRFQAFCTDHLSILLERAHRALREDADQSLIDNASMLAPLRETRSEESRVGKECVRKCRSRGSPDHTNKKKNNQTEYRREHETLST